MQYCFMSNSTNQRLRFFKESLGISTTEFATELGTSQSAMSLILAGKRSLSRGMVARIKQHYPRLNESWLLTGEGDMALCASQSTNSQFTDNGGNNQYTSGGSSNYNNSPMLAVQSTEIDEAFVDLTVNSTPKELMDEIHRLRSMLFSKDEEIKRLKARLK